VKSGLDHETNTQQLSEIIGSLQTLSSYNNLQTLLFDGCVIDSSIIKLLNSSLYSSYVKIELYNAKISIENLKDLLNLNFSKQFSHIHLEKTSSGIYAWTRKANSGPSYLGLRGMSDEKSFYALYDIVKNYSGEKEIELIESAYSWNIDIKDDSVTKLNISQNTLTPGLVNNFSDLIRQKLPGIKALAVNNLKFTDDKAKEAFVKSIFSKNSLTSLELKNLQLSEEEKNSLMTFIEKNPQLESLDLTGIQFTKEWMDRLAISLHGNNKKLVNLQIENATPALQLAQERNKILLDLKEKHKTLEQFLESINFSQLKSDSKNYDKAVDDLLKKQELITLMEKYSYPSSELIQQLKDRIHAKIKLAIEHSPSIESTEKIELFASGYSDLDIQTKMKILAQLGDMPLHSINENVVRKFSNIIIAIENNKIPPSPDALNLLYATIIKFTKNINQANNINPLARTASGITINPIIASLFTLLNKIPERDQHNYKEATSIQIKMGKEIIELYDLGEVIFNLDEAQKHGKDLTKVGASKYLIEIIRVLNKISQSEHVEYKNTFHEAHLRVLQHKLNSVGFIYGISTLINFINSKSYCFPFSPEIQEKYEQTLINYVAHKCINSTSPIHLDTASIISVVSLLKVVKFSSGNIEKLKKTIYDLYVIRIYKEIAQEKGIYYHDVTSADSKALSKHTIDFIKNLHSADFSTIQQHIQTYLKNYLFKGESRLSKSLQRKISEIAKEISDIQLIFLNKVSIKNQNTDGSENPLDDKTKDHKQVVPPEASAPPREGILPVLASAPVAGAMVFVSTEKDVKSTPSYLDEYAVIKPTATTQPVPAQPSVKLPDVKSPISNSYEAIKVLRAKIEKLQGNSIDLQTLNKRFICPISLDLILDPVFDEGGGTYDRTAFEGWIKECKEKNKPVISPLTGLELHHQTCFPNIFLREDILTALNLMLKDLELKKNEVLLPKVSNAPSALFQPVASVSGSKPEPSAPALSEDEKLAQQVRDMAVVERVNPSVSVVAKAVVTTSEKAAILKPAKQVISM
jgi:hypothetical protein